ncbi:uncharacterized protein BO97DRAFT_423795 [Aspergillus homomorphus CBS 101889]|uniref:Uncharacterized protein n=1 Tax=Aspergillus homomorphus (strain CBS 101889) TaxID=1450537 RepID=A0A395HYT9_ASPHC|nr:hypothetical protein BO97DRAFT_423795 [Aspergillus homomorphus CBS 101889]RAL13091.1 hypothetical protein BO97DRAFT_423795 [Aspergillus homomorphus CBS 101889]
MHFPAVGGFIPLSLGIVSSVALIAGADTVPKPESIEVVSLPLPPVVSTDDLGACTRQVNPTGPDLLARWDYVLASLNFMGAPAAPDPASIYAGVHLIMHVVLRNTKTASVLDFVAVTYHNYSDDGLHYIHGHESVTSTPYL